MADLDNVTKQRLETLFEMSGGYVLDFTNASFADFVRTCLGFDPYDHYPGSKANILRALWSDRSWQEVAKLNRELLEQWRWSLELNGKEPSATQEKIAQDLIRKFAIPKDAQADLEFLARDSGEIDLHALPKELTARDVIQARLDEIQRCLEADAPLAVIFLVGSTLEGLLLELAKAKAPQFTSSSAAPRVRDGSTKPLDSWTLTELIQVAHALGIIGADVHGHIDQVRGFRNYIHPRQQMREGFRPRRETALIAQQVLRAAVRDLASLAQLGGVPQL